MKFYFESYGCTMNQGEARIMEDILRDNGHDIVGECKNADALVLVTCTVIETTELKMKKRLLAFSNTQKPVVVAGCMASAQKEQILDLTPNAVILKPQDFQKIGEIADIFSSAIPSQKETIKPKSIPKETAYAIIPISSGCLGSCTYCITRLARGDLKSCPSEYLIESIRSALNQGYREIRLTAQDTGAYGLDINVNLPTLLDRIRRIEAEFRVRVGMMNPDTLMPILPAVIEAYKDPKIYKFLHLPVQSGSERILEMMGRKYTIDEFFNVISYFRKAFPDITISTDIIVGFPQETEKDHALSVELIKKLRPNILNITRFSARPGTKAKDMTPQIPSRIAKERSRELTKVHKEISREINKTLVGNMEHILIAEHGKNQTMMGRTDSYLPVVVNDEISLCEFVDVTITEAKDTYLKGKVL